MKTKRERVREVLASLPPDAGVMPAGELDADEKAPTMHEDGQTMHGGEWTTPSTYQDDDARQGLLPTLKGMTDVELPSMGEPTV